MPNQFNNVQFDFSKYVPDGCIPLSYVNPPMPSIGENLKIVGGAGYVSENTDGAVLKSELGGGVTITSSLPTQTSGVSGVLISDKIPDSTFQYGISPASSGAWWIAEGATSGAIGWNLLMGRTSSNSSYQTGDDPGLGQPSWAQPYCAAGLWNGEDGFFTLQSPIITARASGGELSLPQSEIGYVFSAWIATDPVNTALMRVGPSGQTQDVTQTMLTVNVYAYENGSVVSTIWEGNIGWPWQNTWKYLNQPNTTYLKFQSPVMTLPASSNQIVIQIYGQFAQGVYVDDVRLESVSLVPISQIGGGALSIAGSGILLNPNLTDASHLSGDFSTSFNNLCPDPSFENGQWVIYGTNVYLENARNAYSTHWHGVPRTGNNYMGLEPNTGAGAYVQLLNLSPSNTYVFGGYHYTDTSQGGSIGDSCVLKVEAWNGSSLLGTFISTPISGAASYTLAQFSVNLSAYSTANMWRFKVEAHDTSSNLSYMNWDDMFIQGSGNIIPPWTFQSFQQVTPTGALGVFQQTPSSSSSWPLSYYSSNGGAVLAYDEAGAKFEFNEVNLNESVINHVVQPSVIIYKNGTFALSPDFCNRYFNTEDIMTSENEPVTLNSVYGVSMNLCWPGNVPGLTLDGDNSARGAFAEPFYATFPLPGGARSQRETLWVNDYGRVVVTVKGVASNGSTTETPLSYEISPRDGNLPPAGIRNIGDTNYQAPVIPPSFKFTNSQTVSGNVSISFIATNVGVANVNLLPYSQSQGGTTVTVTGTTIVNNPYSTVYGVSSAITVDGAIQDATGGWRLLVKDGIFERPYVMSSLEPTGSWLSQAGFNNGDNIVLVYTVPEYNLGAQWTDPSNPSLINHYIMENGLICQSITDNIISLGRINAYKLFSLSVNGVTIVASPSGTLVSNLSSEYPSVISQTDSVNGTITLVGSVNSNDLIEASFTYQSDRYSYGGYYDGTSWRDLDLNPGAGHMWEVGVDYRGRSGADLINSPILLYLLPSCAYYASGDSTGKYLYRTAMDVAASGFVPIRSFLRHTTEGGGMQGTVPGYPSAVVLAKIFITPPGVIDDISLMDVRQRGGGIPLSINPANPPVTFNEESRCRIPYTSTNQWSNTQVILYPNDYATITFNGLPVAGTGFVNTHPIGAIIGGVVPTSGTPASYLPTPVWNIVAAPTVNVTGSNYSIVPSGALFLSTLGLNGYGYAYVTITITRKWKSGSVWDIDSWDGSPVMMNGVVIVNIPKAVLTGENGYSQLSTGQVENIVRKHVAAGVLPIIRYV